MAYTYLQRQARRESQIQYIGFINNENKLTRVHTVPPWIKQYITKLKTVRVASSLSQSDCTRSNSCTALFFFNRDSIDCSDILLTTWDKPRCSKGIGNNNAGNKTRIADDQILLRPYINDIHLRTNIPEKIQN